MKILFCTNTFENVQNGPSKFARAILNSNILETNCETELKILTEDISENNPFLLAKRVYKLDLRLNWLTKPWGFIYRMFPYYLAIKKIRNEYDFDIIVFNNAITGIWTAYRIKSPVIGMINDYTSMNSKFDSFNFNKEWVRRKVFKILENIAVKLESGIIVNSNFLFNKVLNTYKLDRKKLKIVSKGVHVDIALPPQKRHISQTIKILFVKSDFIRGGLWDVGKALTLLPQHQFELFIIGPSHRFKNRIEQEISAPNIIVHFIGPAQEVDVFNYMKTCDLYVLPSYHEALGVANMEAILHGIPVITCNQGGIPEVMNHGQNGWMVEPGQPKQLATAITHVLENPKLILEKKIAGYHFIRNHYDIKNTYTEFIKVVTSFYENHICFK